MYKRYFYKIFPMLISILYCIYLFKILPLFVNFDVFVWLFISTLISIVIFIIIGSKLITILKNKNHNYFIVPISFLIGFILYYLIFTFFVDLYRIYILGYWDSFSTYWEWGGGQSDFLIFLAIACFTMVPVLIILIRKCIIIKLKV